MSFPHTVVWLDHLHARIFHFQPEALAAVEVRAPDAHAHLHNRAEVSGRRAENHAYYDEVAVALGDSDEILVVGPSSAKLEFIRHVHGHRPALDPHIVGVETVDHPTDGQIVAYAKKYFRAADRLR